MVEIGGEVQLRDIALDKILEEDERAVMNAPAVDLSHPATFRSQPEDAPITPGKPALTYSRSLITPESSRGDSTLHIVEKEHSPRGLRQALTAAAAAVIRVRPSATDTQQQQCSSSSDRLSEASSVATASSKSLRETHSKATITSDAATQQESRACASISSIQREDEGTPVVSYEGAAVPEAATGAAVPPATSGQRQEESAKDDKHISLNQQAVLELMRFHDQAVEVGRELARSRSSVDSLSKRCQELEAELAAARRSSRLVGEEMSRLRTKVDQRGVELLIQRQKLQVADDKMAGHAADTAAKDAQVNALSEAYDELVMRVMVVVVNAAASMEEIEKACDGGTASDEIKRALQQSMEALTSVVALQDVWFNGPNAATPSLRCSATAAPAATPRVPALGYRSSGLSHDARAVEGGVDSANTHSSGDGTAASNKHHHSGCRDSSPDICSTSANAPTVAELAASVYVQWREAVEAAEQAGPAAISRRQTNTSTPRAAATEPAARPAAGSHPGGRNAVSSKQMGLSGSAHQLQASHRGRSTPRTPRVDRASLYTAPAAVELTKALGGDRRPHLPTQQQKLQQQQQAGSARRATINDSGSTMVQQAKLARDYRDKLERALATEVTLQRRFSSDDSHHLMLLQDGSARAADRCQRHSSSDNGHYECANQKKTIRIPGSVSQVSTPARVTPRDGLRQQQRTISRPGLRGFSAHDCGTTDHILTGRSSSSSPDAMRRMAPYLAAAAASHRASAAASSSAQAQSTAGGSAASQSLGWQRGNKVSYRRASRTLSWY